MVWLEAIIVVIVAAPAYGWFLSFIIGHLSPSFPIAVANSRFGLREISHPLETEISTGLPRLRCRVRSRGACGSVNAASIGLSAAGLALWSLIAGAPIAASAALGSTLLVLSVIDCRHLLLPDVLTLPLLASGIAIGAIVGALPDHVAGAAAGAAFLMLVGSAFGRISGKEGLGMGDVKLFAAGGAWTGWQALPGILLLAALLGLAYAVLSGRTGEGQGRPIAFGPFLAFGIWISWLHGPLSL